ncbi:MAG TPA: helix-turn-helix domain-containing protein [Polyangiaceae bacterium]|jgi:AcrR family transcriptional regulator|nr:helix-turn-helix domain-containing protein [Polyangiaceae bacterium]
MARPVSIPDEQILEAARAVFTEKGPRATTAEIAARAGVSEGILFKRFGNKAGLHRVAMSSDVAGEWVQREMRAQGPLRTQKDLERFIHWQLEVLRDVVPVMAMAWASRAQTDAVPTDLSGPHPAPRVAVETLAAMLREEMNAGHLPPGNAEALAQIVTGSVWYFVFLDLLLEQPGPVDPETLARELARRVLAELEPRKARTKKKTRR